MITKNNFARSIMILTLAASNQAVSAWWASNISMPYDVYQRQCSPCREYIDWDSSDNGFYLSGGVSTEISFDCDGRDKDEKQVGVYQIYSPKDANGNPVEPYGAFFEGASVTDAEINFAQRYYGLTNSDFGDVIVNGKRLEACVNLWGSAALPIRKVPGTLRLTAFVPLKTINTSSTSLASVNASNVNSSMLNLSSNAIANELQTVGKLSANQWNNDNLFNDIFFMLSWHNIFEQNNDTVQKVGLMAQVGLSLPVNTVRGYQNIFSVPAGADGAVGVPLSGSVDVYLRDNFRLFGGVDVYPLFHDNNLRRVRETANQGELLIPDYVTVERKGGTLFRLTASAEFTSNTKMFWGGVGYQYGRRSSDTIAINNNHYSSTVINASERWQESDFQNLLGYVGLDLSQYIERFAPCVNASLRYPLKGKRVALFKTVGLELVMKF